MADSAAVVEMLHNRDVFSKLLASRVRSVSHRHRSISGSRGDWKPVDGVPDIALAEVLVSGSSALQNDGGLAVDKGIHQPDLSLAPHSHFRPPAAKLGHSLSPCLFFDSLCSILCVFFASILCCRSHPGGGLHEELLKTISAQATVQAGSQPCKLDSVATIHAASYTTHKLKKSSASTPPFTSIISGGFDRSLTGDATIRKRDNCICNGNCRPGAGCRSIR